MPSDRQPPAEGNQPGARVFAQARFRFYAELNDFLPPARRQRRFTHRFEGTPAVRDVIEALGVPHAEVDLLLVNDRSVGFDERLGDGDEVAVYPVFEALDVASVTRVRPTPLREPRFILDVHLGKLARDLRLLGFDTAYRNDADDPEIVEQALAERRIILTRDVGLLKRGNVTHGLWVRATRPEAQLREVVDRLQLAGAARPFTRCMACNGLLAPASPEVVAERVPTRAREAFDAFFACGGCERVFWRGSHYAGLVERVAAALRKAR